MVFENAGLSKRVNSKNTKLETLLDLEIHVKSSTTSPAKEQSHRHEAIVGIKRSDETILGAKESMIDVPLDVYEHLDFLPMFDYTQAWITSRYDLILGLKNTESKLELYHFNRYGDEDLPCGARKNRTFPERIFVEGKASKMFKLHRFGQMCFTTNRNKAMWRASDSDHINGDKYDNQKTNTCWLDEWKTIRTIMRVGE